MVFHTHLKLFLTMFGFSDTEWNINMYINVQANSVLMQMTPTQNAAQQWAASQPAGPWWDTGTCGGKGKSLSF